MSTNKLLTRDQVAEHEKWNLEAMYATNDAWEADFKKVQELLPEVANFRGRLGEGASTLLEWMRLNEKIGLTFDNVFVYAHMRYHQNTGDSFYQGLSDRASMLAAEVSSELSFVNPELLGLPDGTLERFMEENEDLRLYKMVFTRLLREKEHVLTPEVEEVLAKVAEIAEAPGSIFSMFSNADLKMPSVQDSEGNEHEVNEGRYRNLLESKDRVLRERAFKSLFGAYGQFRNMLGATYNNNVKKNVFYAKTRHYNTTLEAALSGDNVSVDVYNNLIQANHDNLPHLHRYLELRKKVLGLDELHYYDFFVPMVESVDMTIPWEQGKAMSLDALQPLGEEYVTTVQRAFDERWVDVFPNVGKRTGAYSWGTYTSDPYLFLNYTDTLDDVFTTVHELGHSLHSYYTMKSQPFVYGNYTIFVAEVASTLNENLLLSKMLREETDKKKRMYLLTHSLDQYRSTMFRQTMFAEFEKIVHGLVEEGQPLNADLLSQIYLDLNIKYYGPVLKVDDELKNEWARIPHFYDAFYVYKYATGFAAAAALARQIQEEGAPAVERYLNFLTKGSSEDPLDLLKGAGVDMSSPQPIHDSFKVFVERLDELEKLINEQ
ncbi:oligopeptidase F [Tumebacillus sp. BK434]|uniref:oligoendopeptidase F n=1 Tax=Tumebacillus sp. BK434 TaxID=2512169 RepID=UPI0010DBA154|nr:oligoendopeptidase F [Tumebacillus sp. BK434]TCP55446.1 oligopeptidase F [Tumebacillus sp. BK434]